MKSFSVLAKPCQITPRRLAYPPQVSLQYGLLDAFKKIILAPLP